MPVAVRELLPIMVPPWWKPITVAVDQLVADGADGRLFMLDLTACPLDGAEPVAASPQWHLPQASKVPDPPITLMRLDVARAADLVVVAHITRVLEDKLPQRLPWAHWGAPGEAGAA